MATTLRRLALAAIFLLILWGIWSRMTIIIIGRFTDLLLMFGVLVVAFLVLDHILNRERR